MNDNFPLYVMSEVVGLEDVAVEESGQTVYVDLASLWEINNFCVRWLHQYISWDNICFNVTLSALFYMHQEKKTKVDIYSNFLTHIRTHPLTQACQNLIRTYTHITVSQSMYVYTHITSWPKHMLFHIKKILYKPETNRQIYFCSRLGSSEVCKCEIQ